MLIWLILLVAFWVVVWPKLMDIGRTAEFNALANHIKTDENKGNIEQLIEFHNQRCNSGANKQMSFDRMVRDLKSLAKTKDEEEPSV